MKETDIGEHPSEPSYETLRAQVEYWREAALVAERKLKKAQSLINTFSTTHLQEWCESRERYLNGDQE